MRTPSPVRRSVLLPALLVAPALTALLMGGCPLDLGDGGGNGDDLAFSRVAVGTIENGGASGVTVADFNGDGLWDLASVWKDAGMIHLHLQQHAADVITWQDVALFGAAIVPGAQDIAAADINGDGRADLVVGTDRGQMLYLRQLGDNPTALNNWSFSGVVAAQGSDIRSWYDLEAADVDGDGLPEIIATMDSPGGRVSIFNPPAGSVDGSDWQRIDVATLGRTGASAVIPVDIDGDGDIDLFSLARREETQSVVWFENPGNATALTAPWTRREIGHVADARWAYPSDVNRDGLLDLVVSSGTGKALTWFERPGDPTLAWAAYPVASLGTAQGGGVAAWDIDGDGKVEIFSATASEGKLSVFEPAVTEWTESIIDAPGGSFDNLILLDIDDDGLLDLLTTRSGGTSEVLWYRQVQ